MKKKSAKAAKSPKKMEKKKADVVEKAKPVKSRKASKSRSSEPISASSKLRDDAVSRYEKSATVPVEVPKADDFPPSSPRPASKASGTADLFGPFYVPPPKFSGTPKKIAGQSTAFFV